MFSAKRLFSKLTPRFCAHRAEFFRLRALGCRFWFGEWTEIELIFAGAIPAGPLQTPDPVESSRLNHESLRIEETVADVEMADETKHNAILSYFDGAVMVALEGDLAN